MPGFERERPEALELHIRDHQGHSTHHRLPPGEYRLGKGEDCDIRLQDPFASRRHARIRISRSRAVIEDLGSTNGTWNGGRRLEAPEAIAHGSLYTIGESRLLFLRPDGQDASGGAGVEGGVEEAAAARGAAAATPPADGESATEQTRMQIPVVVDAETADDAEVQAFKQHVHRLLLEYLDRHKRAVVHTLSDAELRREATEAVRMVMRDHELAPPVGISDERLVREVVAEAVGLGPLEPLLEDASVTEIMVNGHEQIYVERGGRLCPIDSIFTSEASLLSIIERIVAPLGRRIDEGSPTVDARLADGSRVNAVIPPLSLVGPVLTIRKFAREQLTMDDLIRNGSMSPEMARFLAVCVRQRKNIIVSGGTGSGKTTTLNILSNFIPDGERIVTIEDAAELRLRKQHVVRLESRPPNVEGRGEVTIRDLVRNALRMRPDRIVVGECRGGEALDMLQAMNTGHDGSLTTGHANSPRDFLSRLEVMVLMSGIELPVRAIREQIASAVDIIVQQTRFSDGRRRITSIEEVDGMEGDVILLQRIFEYRQTGRSAEGATLGYFTGCGYAPTFYEELAESMPDLDRSIFARREPGAAGMGGGTG